MRRLFSVMCVMLVPLAVACPTSTDDQSELSELDQAKEYNEFLRSRGLDTIPLPEDVAGDSSPSDAPRELSPEEREAAGDIYELDEATFQDAVAAETDCETLRPSFIVSGLGVEQGEIDADKDTVVDRAGVIAARLNELGCYDDE